jgi:hypothetical protein
VGCNDDVGDLVCGAKVIVGASVLVLENFMGSAIDSTGVIWQAGKIKSPMINNVRIAFFFIKGV